MSTWTKRLLGVAVFTVALGIGAEVRSLTAPYRDPPAEISGWRLGAAPVCGNSIPPDARGWRGVATARRICTAEYHGATAIRLTLFDLPGYPAGGGAFDAWQKWPPNQTGKVGFWMGRYFAVAESPEAERATLDRFAVSFARGLTGSEPAGRW